MSGVCGGKMHIMWWSIFIPMSSDSIDKLYNDTDHNKFTQCSGA